MLPGLDGTGKLFTPLIKELDSSIMIQTINYYTQKKQTYDELVEYVLEKLPKDDFVLVAESFSGFIAYQIGLKKLKNLKHIILVATFLKNPNPLLLNLLPGSFVFLLPIPKLIIKKFFLGSSSDDKTIDLFQKSVKSISNKLLDFRLKQIKTLNSANQKLTIPTTYIQAKDDQLVLKNSLDDFKKVCDDLTIYQVEGKHFILQSNPKKCANIIESILQ